MYSNPAGISFSAVAGSGCSWLSPSNSSATTPATLSYSVNSSSQAPGNYACTITVSTPNYTVEILATLAVTATSLSVNPSSLSFSYQLNGTAPSAQFFTIASANPASGVSFTIAPASSCGWLNLSATSGTTQAANPAAVIATVNTSGLVANTSYSCKLTISSPNATTTAQVSATLSVSPSCSFALAPSSQVIPAAAGTGSVGVLTTAGCPWTATSATSFLSIISGSSGTGPGVVQFSATANTSVGAQTGTLTIAGQTATINQAGTSPLLLLTPSSLAVQWRQQSPLPAAIQLSVFTSASSLNFTATASSNENWLTVSPAVGSAPATIIATVNPSSLQPGTYQGTVTVTAPTANPSSQTFTVSLTVIAVGPPTLSVTTINLSYSFAQGAQQVRQERILIGNSGSGTLSYDASASTASGGNWLSVTQDGAGATLLTPDPLTVSVDPISLGVGTYTGQITITTAAATQNIPVTVTVSAIQQTILLSQTGLTFTAVVNGGIVPAQTFGILNSGNGVMDWSLSSTTVTGGSWLSITPTSGTTDASSLTVPLVTVSVNPASLAAGQYSGQIQVTSTTADDTPQFVSVILNVLPAGSDPGPLVLPTGLIFTQQAGGTVAGSQTITLSNLTASQQTFTTGTLTNDGANWFTVTPTTGAATPTQATILTVSVSSSGLSPAIRQGVLTLLFQDGSVRTVNVLFLLATGGVSSQSAGVSHPRATSGSCTPTRLLPLVTSLGSQFTVPAGWPNTLETQVVDDCGNPLMTGTVTATFSNGDAPLSLTSLKNGNWTGTWQVNNANAPLIAITVDADNPSLGISGSTSVSGSLQSAANAPVMSTGGVLNAASYSVSSPLSPGTIIAIFGSNLANGTSSSSTLPLSTQLSGTLVIIGGVPAPLLYVSQGQINAVIPYGLPVNTHTQVIVLQGNAYTSPQSITLSAANPAIFTQSSSGTGQGVIIGPDGQYAAPGTPVQAGQEVVIYAGGLGDTTPEATAGQASTSSPLLYVANPVTLTIGGQSARVDFAGLVPTLTGLYQINAAVPTGVQGDTLPVVLTVAGQPSPAVTMAVQ
jgi:trimeric autotransporter adhesin